MGKNSKTQYTTGEITETREVYNLMNLIGRSDALEFEGIEEIVE